MKNIQNEKIMQIKNSTLVIGIDVGKRCFLTDEGQIVLRDYHVQIGTDRLKITRRGILMFIATTIVALLLRILWPDLELQIISILKKYL